MARLTLRTRVVIVVLLLVLSGVGAWYLPALRSPQTRQDQYALGLKALENKDYTQAIERFSRTIDRAPDADAYYHRGLASYFAGHVESAIADWDRALVLAPNWALAFRQRANAFVEKGDFARGLSDYNRAIELEPQEPKAYYNRALLHQKREAPAKAISDLQTALALSPDAELEQAAKKLLQGLSDSHPDGK